MQKLIKKDVVIIGAGASGLICAIESGRRLRSVLVLDHSEKPAKKIRASGGGRCNFANLNIGHENYISDNPYFCRSALARFTPNDFITMLEKHKIEYYEKEKGQLFCKQTSSDIIKMLLKECNDAGVEIKLNCRITRISKQSNFLISTNFGNIQAESLVIATGGLSYPELGSTDFGLRIAKQFGLNIVNPRPALVPLLFSHRDLQRFRELSGASLNAVVTCNKKQFAGQILFTHSGLSGPAILQASSYWNKGDEIIIDLLPGNNAYELLSSKRTTKMELSTMLSFYLPKRFCKIWCETYSQSRALNSYSEKELKLIAENLHKWIIKPESSAGYKKAEVTAGGIDTNELSSKTMEVKKVPGLYFIGEVIDVTGHLGGYNLQWAWSSGFAAGQFV